MSGKHLNDISKVYLDTIANVKKAETDADIKRWEDLGGPTPGNYRADDNSAKLKEGRRLRKSDWRQDLKEVIDKPETEEKAEKKIDEKKIKNKIVINPTFKEAIQEIGGELLEVNAVDSVEKTQQDTQQRQEKHKKQLEAKQKKIAAMKKLVLRKKMQAVGAGGGEDITAGYEPEGELIEGKKKGLDGKACWDGYKLAGTKKKGGKTVDNCVKEDELQEKDLSAAERRALPDKDFALPGKGEGPEGKQRGAYPINDKKHARAALAMAAAHASPEKEAKVKAAVKKKYPEIEVSEGKAVGTVVKQLGRIAAKKLQSKKVKKAIYKKGKEIVKKVGGAGLEGAVDAATDRARETGGNIVRDAGKKKEVKEAAPLVAMAGKAALSGVAFAAGEAGVKKVLKSKEKKKEVDEGVLSMVKSIGKKKKEKKATMDSTTDKIHQWRKDKEKEERRKYVSDFDPIDKVNEADDKAYNYVVSQLKKKYGDGVLTKGDKMPQPTAAQKKKNAEIMAKRAKEDHRDPTEKASDGRYSDRYSNRGSD